MTKDERNLKPESRNSLHCDQEPDRPPARPRPRHQVIGSRTRTRTRTTTRSRFMESPLSFFRMHWDHEPTPDPSKEGSRTAWPGPLPGGVRGGFVADGTNRFMESPLDFCAVHWDLEPDCATKLVWYLAFRRPGPAKAGTPNRRFMESLHFFLKCIAIRNQIVLLLVLVLEDKPSNRGRGRERRRERDVGSWKAPFVFSACDVLRAGTARAQVGVSDAP